MDPVGAAAPTDELVAYGIAPPLEALERRLNTSGAEDRLEGRLSPAHSRYDRRSLLVRGSAALVTAGVYEAGTARLDPGAQPKYTPTARA